MPTVLSAFVDFGGGEADGLVFGFWFLVADLRQPKLGLGEGGVGDF